MPDLIVIVDPQYGDRLEALAQLAPVWMVDTHINKESVERAWKTRPDADHREKGGVTAYKTQNPEERLSSLLGVMPDLEIHHGSVENNELVFPKGFVLSVVGLTISDDVMSALQNFGFTSFIETAEGFEACK
jgi:hypothetical protein